MPERITTLLFDSLSVISASKRAAVFQQMAKKAEVVVAETLPLMERKPMKRPKKKTMEVSKKKSS